MKTKTLFLLAAALTLASCDDREWSEPATVVDCPETVSVVDGHLRFESEADFAALAEKLRGGDAGQTRTRGMVVLPGFTSVYMAKEATGRTRSEETEIELAALHAEELLQDPVLLQVLDTSLTIEIGPVVTRITDSGTFTVLGENAGMMDDIIASLDTVAAKRLGAGESMVMDDGTSIFTNTFGEGSTKRWDGTYEGRTKAPTAVTYVNHFESGYGTRTFQWKNSLLKNILLADFIKGKDISEENGFDDTHRVQFTVYDLNFHVFATTGMKVRFQKQKKVLGVKYWVADKAEGFAVGFNDLETRRTYTQPVSMSRIAEIPSAKWNTFCESVDGIARDYVRTLTAEHMLRDWTTKAMLLVTPDYVPLGKKECNALYDLAETGVIRLLRSAVSTPVAGVAVRDSDPAMAFLVKGVTDDLFTADRVCVTGVQEYPAGEGVDINLDWSVGVAVNVGTGISVTPFLPSSVDITRIDAFGAAKYGGVWKGVRFTLNN